jgi:dihydroneopterin aldolase
MAEIALEGIEFKGYHGLYPNEKVNGNIFILDIKAFAPPPRSSDPDQPSLGRHWPDYARIYALAQAAFLEPQDLLEQVISAILVALKQEWPAWTFEVSLRKTNPPIARAEGQSAIRIPCSRVTMRCSDLAGWARTP